MLIGASTPAAQSPCWTAQTQQRMSIPWPCPGEASTNLMGLLTAEGPALLQEQSCSRSCARQLTPTGGTCHSICSWTRCCLTRSTRSLAVMARTMAQIYHFDYRKLGGRLPAGGGPLPQQDGPAWQRPTCGPPPSESAPQAAVLHWMLQEMLPAGGGPLPQQDDPAWPRPPAGLLLLHCGLRPLLVCVLDAQ